MSNVLIEGYTIAEVLALPNETLQALVLRDEPLVFSAGSANLLGRFKVDDGTLVMELVHIDGGGEGALPTLMSLAAGYARREHLAAIEWRVHAVHCARPNAKLRRVLLRKGFEVRTLEAVGECYCLRVPLDATPGAVVYELWQEPDGFSFFPADNASARAQLAPGAHRVWSCTAASWDEAQASKARFLAG